MMMKQSKSLYDRHWRKRRSEQLRLHPLCRLCADIWGRVTAATVADHITPHRGNPVLFAGPLQSLCASCHSGWKQQLETSGRIRGCDASGIPLDRAHHWNTPSGGSAGQEFRPTVHRPSPSARSVANPKKKEPPL